MDRRYVGIDLHRRRSVIVTMDDGGEVLSSVRISNDPVAMSIALDPSIGQQSSQHYVDIETASELTRGMTVVDRLGVAADDRNRATWAHFLDLVPKAKVYWAIDAPRWKQALYSALG